MTRGIQIDDQSLLKATIRASTVFRYFTPRSKAPLVSGSWVDPSVLPHRAFRLWPTSRTRESPVYALICLRDGLVQNLVSPGRTSQFERILLARNSLCGEIRPLFFRILGLVPHTDPIPATCPATKVSQALNHLIRSRVVRKLCQMVGHSWHFRWHWHSSSLDLRREH
jgi:hypothetical protein